MWTDIFTNPFYFFQIIKAGKEDSSRPLAGQEVSIKCEGTLPNGEKVDVKEELKFIIGDGDVVTGWSYHIFLIKTSAPESSVHSQRCHRLVGQAFDFIDLLAICGHFATIYYFLLFFVTIYYYYFFKLQQLVLKSGFLQLVICRHPILSNFFFPQPTPP